MPGKIDDLMPTAGKFQDQAVIRGENRDETLIEILLDISRILTLG